MSGEARERPTVTAADLVTLVNVALGAERVGGWDTHLGIAYSREQAHAAINRVLAALAQIPVVVGDG